MTEHHSEELGPERQKHGGRVIARWNSLYARVLVSGLSATKVHPGGMRFPPPPDGWALLLHGATLAHATAEMRAVAAELVEAADEMDADHG